MSSAQISVTRCSSIVLAVDVVTPGWQFARRRLVIVLPLRGVYRIS
jgi:hypothetical protein